MRLKRMLGLVLCGVAAAAPGLAQEAPAKPKAEEPKAAAAPTVDQILDKFAQALGGKAAFDKLTTRVSKGTFAIDAMNASGPIEITQKAPGKLVTTIEITGFGAIKEGTDGSTAWAQDPVSGLRDKSGPELAAAKLDGEFYRDIKLKQLYPKMEVKGKEKLGEREAYIISATPPEGDPEKMYFDTQNGLLVRLDVEREGPQGKLPFEIYYEDYREVDGVKLPFVTRLTNPAFAMTVTLSEVKHNAPVEDAKFNKPSAQ